MKNVKFALLLLLSGQTVLWSCKDKDSAKPSPTDQISATGAAENFPATRDKYKWPFAKTSIWNMPIGSSAKYEPANLPTYQSTANTFYVGIDQEWHIMVSSTDPVQDVFEPSSWGKRWPGNGKKLGTCPVPNDLIIPDADGNHTPNACTVFFLPDGKHIRQLEPACRVEAGKHIVGYIWNKDEDLYGAGIGGTHWGSGLSALGGSIRPGELLGNEPIRHALKLNVWGQHLYYNASSVKGFRWPATLADGAAPTSYKGTNPKLVMGSLLAIPPGYILDSLHLKTNVAKKLFTALQNYGAYISDDSGWSGYDWCMSREVVTEMKQANQNIDGAQWDAHYKDYLSDMKKIIPILHIIDNNSSSSIGGGGTPRQPMAPEISN